MSDDTKFVSKEFSGLDAFANACLTVVGLGIKQPHSGMVHRTQQGAPMRDATSSLPKAPLVKAGKETSERQNKLIAQPSPEPSAATQIKPAAPVVIKEISKERLQVDSVDAPSVHQHYGEPAAQGKKDRRRNSRGIRFPTAVSELAEAAAETTGLSFNGFVVAAVESAAKGRPVVIKEPTHSYKTVEAVTRWIGLLGNATGLLNQVAKSLNVNGQMNEQHHQALRVIGTELRSLRTIALAFLKGGPTP